MKKGKFTISPFKVVPLAALCLGSQAVSASSVDAKVYGQVNRAFVQSDDGKENHTYFVDNDSSQSRLGVLATGKMNEDWSVGGQVEVGFVVDSTSSVWQKSRNSGESVDVRRTDFWMDHGRFGKLSLGHGSMAADGTHEMDLSDTWLVEGASFCDWTNAFRFHPKGQTRPVFVDGSDPSVGSYLCDMDGGRKGRVRYDTPSFNGFGFAVSHGLEASGAGNTRSLWDAALTYSNQFDMFALDAALSWQGKGDNDIVGGSASLLHKDTGLNLTVTAGKDSLDENHWNRQFAGRTSDPMYWYTKLGWKADLVHCGKTNFGLGYMSSKHSVAKNDKATGWGLGVVQNFDKINTNGYLGWKNHKLKKLDNTGTGQTNTNASRWDNLNAVIVGFLFKF